MSKTFLRAYYFFYHFAISILSSIRVFPTLLTPKRDLELLIRKLHPISSSNQLIRIGPYGDGGYLVPDDLSGIKACFSPGVCDNSGFELACANLGMKVFLADKSVEGPAMHHDDFSFIKKFIGSKTTDDFITIDEWVDFSLPGSKDDLLLQMDIEGFEYETFLSMSNSLLKRFRIIVVEFHHLEILWSKPYFRIASAAFEKILQTHSCVHIHPNNCSGIFKTKGLVIPGNMEFTFLRKDRINNLIYVHKFPHMLDSNNINAKPVVLPKCWYRNEN